MANANSEAKYNSVKQRLEQKSKKLEDVIDRLCHRILWLESVQYSVYKELQGEKERLVPEIENIKTLLERHFTEAFASLQCIFDKQRNVCKQIIQHAKEMIDSAILLSKDGGYSDMLLRSKQLEDLLVCSLIILDEDSKLSIKRLPEIFTQFHGVCHHVLHCKLHENAKQITDSLVVVTESFKQVAEKNYINYDIAACHFPFDSMEDSIPDGNVSFSSDYKHSISTIPDLQFSNNSVFTSYVYFAHSLTTYVLSPCDEQFIRFSEELSKYGYQEEQILICSKKKKFLENLVANTVCCAKFSGDNCWYRAKIVSKDSERVVVNYLDYGNHELIPLYSCRLLPLPESFTKFPANSVVCNLKFPDNYFYLVPDAYVDSFYHWLLSVLYNTVLQVHVRSCYSNEIDADIVLPSNALRSEESVYFLQRISLDVNDLVKSGDGPVQLLTILCILRDAACAIEGGYSVRTGKVKDDSINVTQDVFDMRSTNGASEIVDNAVITPEESNTEHQIQHGGSEEMYVESSKNINIVKSIYSSIPSVEISVSDATPGSLPVITVPVQLIPDFNPETDIVPHSSFISSKLQVSALNKEQDEYISDLSELSLSQILDDSSLIEDFNVEGKEILENCSENVSPLVCLSVNEDRRCSSPKLDEVHEMSFDYLSTVNCDSQSSTFLSDYEGDISLLMDTVPTCSQHSVTQPPSSESSHDKHPVVNQVVDCDQLHSFQSKLSLTNENTSSSQTAGSESHDVSLSEFSNNTSLEYLTPLISDSQTIKKTIGGIDINSITSSKNISEYNCIAKCLDLGSNETKLQGVNTLECISEVSGNANCESCMPDCSSTLYESNSHTIEETACHDDKKNSCAVTFTENGSNYHSVMKQFDYSAVDTDRELLVTFSDNSHNASFKFGCSPTLLESNPHVQETACHEDKNRSHTETSTENSSKNQSFVKQLNFSPIDTDRESPDNLLDICHTTSFEFDGSNVPLQCDSHSILSSVVPICETESANVLWKIMPIYHYDKNHAVDPWYIGEKTGHFFSKNVSSEMKTVQQSSSSIVSFPNSPSPIIDSVAANYNSIVPYSIVFLGKAVSFVTIPKSISTISFQHILLKNFDTFIIYTPEPRIPIITVDHTMCPSLEQLSTSAIKPCSRVFPIQPANLIETVLHLNVEKVNNTTIEIKTLADNQLGKVGDDSLPNCAYKSEDFVLYSTDEFDTDALFVRSNDELLDTSEIDNAPNMEAGTESTLEQSDDCINASQSIRQLCRSQDILNVAEEGTSCTLDNSPVQICNSDTSCVTEDNTTNGLFLLTDTTRNDTFVNDNRNVEIQDVITPQLLLANCSINKEQYVIYVVDKIQACSDESASSESATSIVHNEKVIEFSNEYNSNEELSTVADTKSETKEINEANILEASVIDSLLRYSPIDDDNDDDEMIYETTFIPPPPEFCEELADNEKEESTNTNEEKPCSPISPISPCKTQGTNQSRINDEVFKTYHHMNLKLDDEFQFHLLVSHVESPSLFYVFPINQVGSLLHELEADLFKYYSDISNCTMINIKPGTPCCVKSMEDGAECFYRGLLISTAISSMDQIVCTILCVDYGWTVLSFVESVYKLDDQFFMVPVLVMACSLFGLIPPFLQKIKSSTDQSLDSNNSYEELDASPILAHCCDKRGTGTWSKNALENFNHIVGDNVLVGIVYEKDSSRYIHGMFVKHGVLLYDTSGEEDVLINYLLVELRLAMLCVNDDDKSENMSIEDWNPMEKEYLSSRNDYSVDDEDVGSGLLQEDHRIDIPCKFYNTVLGCYKENCQYQHAQDSPCLSKEVYAAPTTTILPSSYSWVLILVTAVHSTNRFMGIAVGTLENTEVKSYDPYLDFLKLLNEMDSFYNTNSHEYKVSSYPSPGEIVCVWNKSHGHWYRSLIIMEDSDNRVKVFYIDVGYEDEFPLEKIFSLCPQFIHVPSQAVECVLSNTCIPTCKTMTQDARDKGKNAVCKLTSNNILLAKINYRNNLVLHVEMFKTGCIADNRHLSYKENLSLNNYLIAHGHLITDHKDKLTLSLHGQTGATTGKVVFMPG